MRAAEALFAASRGWSTDCITAVDRQPPRIQAMMRWVGILPMEEYSAGSSESITVKPPNLGSVMSTKAMSRM